MPLFTTLKRVMTEYGEIRMVADRRIECSSWDKAEEICRRFYPDLVVDGEFVEEIQIAEHFVENIKKSNFL